MCGIVGLFLKNKALEPELGTMLSGMLATMCDRGPDSQFIPGITCKRTMTTENNHA